MKNESIYHQPARGPGLFFNILKYKFYRLVQETFGWHRPAPKEVGAEEEEEDDGGAKLATTITTNS